MKEKQDNTITSQISLKNKEHLNNFEGNNPEVIIDFLVDNTSHFKNIIGKQGLNSIDIEDALQYTFQEIIAKPPHGLLKAKNRVAFLTQIVKYKARDYQKKITNREFHFDPTDYVLNQIPTVQEDAATYNFEDQTWENLLKEASTILNYLQSETLKITLRFGVGISDFDKLGMKDKIKTYLLLNIYSLEDAQLQDSLQQEELYNEKIVKEHFAWLKDKEANDIISLLELDEDAVKTIRRKIRVIRQKTVRQLTRELIRLNNDGEI